MKKVFDWLRRRQIAIGLALVLAAAMPGLALAQYTITLWSSSIGDVQLTPAIIGALGGDQSGPTTSTTISTVGNGTLTAAAIKGGVIARTGPVANFTDTTDTAANIVAALTVGLPGQGGAAASLVGNTLTVTFKNATPYSQTISAGAGVTMSVANVVAPISAGTYFGLIGGTAAAPTITFTHLTSVPIRASGWSSDPQATALITVGAGTITAAGINTGIVTRGGTQVAAFTDTTDTAANIQTGIPGLANVAGSAVYWTYVNNTVFPATIAGGTGVTISGTTIVPANSWVQYLVTNTTLTSAVSLTALSQGYFPVSGTFTANGASAVVVAAASVTANSVITFTAKTIGGTPAGAPFLSAVTAGTGFSVKAAAGDTSVYTYEIRG